MTSPCIFGLSLRGNGLCISMSRRERQEAVREVYRGDCHNGGQAEMQQAFERRAVVGEKSKRPHFRRIRPWLVGLGYVRVPKETAQAV